MPKNFDSCPSRFGGLTTLKQALSALAVESRHCEERSDAAIHKLLIYLQQWIASLTLAMTNLKILLQRSGCNSQRRNSLVFGLLSRQNCLSSSLFCSVYGALGMPSKASNTIC